MVRYIFLHDAEITFVDLLSYQGAFFGTTFPHLFFQSYRELAPAPFWKPTSGHSSSPTSSRSPSPEPEVQEGEAGGQAKRPKAPAFQNPNPHGGQKRPAGRVYQPKIYGFRVSEQAKSGPRMLWMRLRPQDPEELDMVDWRGRFYDDEDDEYDQEEGAEEDRPMEDFDPVGGLCLLFDLWWLTTVHSRMVMMRTMMTKKTKQARTVARF